MWVLSPPHPKGGSTGKSLPSRDNGFLSHVDGVLPAPPQVLPAPPNSFCHGQRWLIHGVQIGVAVLSSHGRYWPHSPRFLSGLFVFFLTGRGLLCWLAEVPWQPDKLLGPLPPKLGKRQHPCFLLLGPPAGEA